MYGITIGDSGLKQTKALRSTVLAWQQLEIAPDRDRRARHFVARTDDGVTVGCASCGPAPFPDVAFDEHSSMRFWGVAVLAPYRGRGIGQALMRAVLARGSELAVDLVWANARKSALSFYTDLRFETVGDPFTDALSGLDDRRVVLHLTDANSRKWIHRVQ
ncbi:GNAT family N-acetyltransferase [Cryobacterium serini]|uniref:N-acetyltransferase n=1 Tax=Cryobacterium serini TaxID=1259201 RepID=A0A4R9BWN8_9MICO|nr:N-acetyltransferase [Cryobacterium serini]